MSLYNVVRRPLITEKSTALSEEGKYVFEVSDDATKARIKEAVELAFSVNVVKVNVMGVKGKVKRFGRRPKPLKSWKKAVVTLKQGDKIELFASA
ncbi:50S ribosomal protein L23 [Dehalococcoidia bacterium]|nr:50S ribosomal protein L23 [Dehalococcoidia bacterium]